MKIRGIYSLMLIVMLLLPGYFSSAAVSAGGWEEKARALTESEQYAEAEAIYAANCETAQGLKRSRILQWWGGCLRHLGEYGKAEKKYSEALNILVDFDDELADHARVNLAILYNDMGRYKEAQSLLKAVTSANRKPYARLYEAESLFRQGDNAGALAICGEILNDSNADKALKTIAHNNRAYILMEINDALSLLQAESDLLLSLDEFDNSKDEYYISLSNLAIVEARIKKFEEAVENINRSVAWFSAGKSKDSTVRTDYIIGLRKRAEIYMMMHDMHSSREAYKEYFEAEREYLQRNFATFTEQNRLDLWKKERTLLSPIFGLEDSASKFLLDVAIFRREIALLGGNPTNKADSVKLRDKIKNNLNLKGKDIRSRLSSGEVAFEIIKYDKRDSITGNVESWYGAIIVPSNKSTENVRFIPLYREKELNEYRINNRKLSAAICSASRVSDKNGIYSSERLAKYIWSPLQEYIGNAKKIYFVPDGIFQMFAIEYLYPLAESKSDIPVIRLTSLSQLKSGRKTGSNRNKKRNNSQQVLAIGGLNYDSVMSSETESNTTLRAVGNSDQNHEAANYLSQYVPMQYGIFGYLPGSKREVEEIDSIYIAVDTTFVATEEMFKRIAAAGKYRRIHLSTHGYSLQVSEDPQPYALRDSITEDKTLLASGIAFTGANQAYKYGDREDGIISAKEFCMMDFSDVDLMVVSVCQSAQGVISDEGPAGIVRGLKKAGVQSIIATLWEVDDTATGLFMRYFYESLKEDDDKQKAIITAQKKLKDYTVTVGRQVFDAGRMATTYKEETIQPYTSPYYWAPFILIDN